MSKNRKLKKVKLDFIRLSTELFEKLLKNMSEIKLLKNMTVNRI